MIENEPELFIEARKAYELYVKEVELFRRADAIAQRGDAHPRKPEWREDTVNMVEGDLVANFVESTVETGEVRRFREASAFRETLLPRKEA